MISFRLLIYIKPRIVEGMVLKKSRKKAFPYLQNKDNYRDSADYNVLFFKSKLRMQSISKHFHLGEKRAKQLH